LAHLPKNKTVVLGLISSKLPELEDPKQISGRIDEAAKILGDPEKKRICLSPQCGFASHIEGNKVPSSLFTTNFINLIPFLRLVTVANDRLRNKMLRRN
jgi:hypothetical protein